MTREPDKYDIYDLLILLVENDLTDSQRDYLVRWSQVNPDAVDIYHDFLRDYSIVSQEVSNAVNYEPSFDMQFDRSLWAALSEYEKVAPLIPIPKEAPRADFIPKVVHERVAYKFSKSTLAALVFSAVSILFIATVFLLPPRISHEPVARILSSEDAEWHQEQIPGSRSVLMKGPLGVTRGKLKLAMYDGTEVTLQAPAVVELEKINQIYLDRGLLVAAVPPAATGFTICTPHGSIVDYGTEFSVEVDPKAKTLVDVLRGVVELRDSSNPLVFHNSRKLSAGQKGQIDANGKITWNNSVRYTGNEIRIQWQCPDAAGLWNTPSFWSQGLPRSPELVAELTATEAAKTILVDSSMVGLNKIIARRADVGLTSSYPVTVRMEGGEVQLEQLWIGRMGLDADGAGQWIMSDGQLVLKGRDPINLLVGDECKGLMEVRGGQVEVYGEVKIGRDEGGRSFVRSDGTLAMKGGQMTIHGLLDVAEGESLGKVYLDGGKLYAFNLRIEGQGVLVITGGVLVLEGNKAEAVRSLVDTRKIQCPDADLTITYDETDRLGYGRDKTILYRTE